MRSVIDKSFFAQAMWDVVADVRRHTEGRRGTLAGGLQKNCCYGAVDVVVAVDEDGLMREKRLPDALDGFAHAVHGVRIVEVREGRVEELCCRGYVCMAARNE